MSRSSRPKIKGKSGVRPKVHNVRDTSRKSSSSLTPHIVLGATGVDELGDHYMVIRIPSGTTSDCLVRLNDLTKHQSDVFNQLNRAGAHLISNPARQELISRVQRMGYQPSSFQVATRLGWHGNAFILPGKIFHRGPTNYRTLFDDSRQERFDRYRTGGTLVGWQELPRLARGNSRFMLALTIPFVGPILPILETEQVGVQLVGHSQSGRTTLLKAAGSVWGRHVNSNQATNLGFGMSWNATLHDIEAEAYAASHTIIILDETRAAATDWLDLVKQTTSALIRWDGGVRKGTAVVIVRHTWATPLLSGSNFSLCEMALKSTAVPVDDAFLTRLIDVPLPDGGYGVFEHLRGTADGGKLAERIEAVTRQHFGHPSRRFLTRLVAWRQRDEQGLVQWLQERRRRYRQQASLIVSPGRQLGRLHQRFATLYAAGSLAIEFDILPWRRTALLDALLLCTRDHVKLINRVAPQLGSSQLGQSQPDPRQRLRVYVQQHRASFVDLRPGYTKTTTRQDIIDCVGYITVHKGVQEYLFAGDKFGQIAGGHAAAAALKRGLAAAGKIGKAKGVGWNRYLVKRRIGLKANGKTYRADVVAIPESALVEN